MNMSTNKIGIDYIINELVMTCIVCSKNAPHAGFKSLEESLPQVEPVITVYEALKLLSNFKYIDIDTQKCKICDTCFLNASLARLFQQLCNKSVANIETYINAHSDIKEEHAAKRHRNDSQNNSVITAESMDHSEQNIEANKMLDVQIKSEEIVVTVDHIQEEVNEQNYATNDDNLVGVDETDDEEEDITLSDLKVKIFPKSETSPTRIKTLGGETKRKKVKQCPECNKVLRSDSLVRHMRTHTGERPYQCQLCEKAFTVRSSLNDHMRHHSNERPFLCTFCGSSFHQKATLQDHIRIHTGERPYVCETCGKAFRTGQDRKIHYSVHSDEKPFACEKCPKRFPTARSLRQHSVVHMEVKPWECTFCGKRFPHKHVLKSHQAKTCPGIHQSQ